MVELLQSLQWTVPTYMIPSINEFVYLNNKMAFYESLFKFGYKYPLFTTVADGLYNIEVFILPRFQICPNPKIADITKGVQYLKQNIEPKAKLLGIDFGILVMKRFFGECGESVIFLKDKPGKELIKKINSTMTSQKCLGTTYEKWYIEPFCSFALKEHRFYIVNGKILYCIYSYHKEETEGFHVLNKFINTNEIILTNPESIPTTPNPFVQNILNSPSMREIIDNCVLHIYNSYISVRHNTLPTTNFFVRIDISIIYNLNQFSILVKEIESINSAYHLLGDSVGEVDSMDMKTFVTIVEQVAGMYKNLIFQNTCLKQSLAVPQVRLLKSRAKDPSELKKRKKPKRIIFQT